ncbi:glycosyltransferase 61 family protein [Xanthobacter flavus]|uniref:glycosyltransferase family 61 protein n=1 Tax=Xanthobacter flavus TaxID=281 RepID=UPI003727AAD6
MSAPELTLTLTTTSERDVFCRPKQLLYPDYNENDGLIVPPNLNVLPNPIHRPNYARHFRIIHEHDAKIIGFRSIITSDEKFFVDESEADNFSYRRLFAKFSDGQNEECDFVERDGSVSGLFDPDPIVIEQPVIFVGSDEPSNFGSWLYRIIPKLIDAPYRDFPVLVYNNAPWMTGLIGRMFGGNVSFVNHWPRRGYVLRDALIPTLRNVDVYFDEEVRSFYKYSASMVDGKSPLEKIYLSRRGQKLRPLLNEAELEDRLVGSGFSIVRPETMSITDQIRTIRDARIIVCPGGSGLFPMVFATSAEFILDLEAGPEWVFAHHNLLRSTARRHTILFGTRVEGTQSPHASWRVDVDAVMTALAYGAG